MKILAAQLVFAASALAFSTLASVPAMARSKTFHSPKVGGKMLDGCYSWPGPCKSKRQANAFCRRKGFDFAADFEASNEFGAYQAKRLGDGGVCTASCTVMQMVRCSTDEGDDDDDYGDED
ncbi:MAG: hypothetical protein R3D51_11875 [Hyphomicrobiaceae bacterium]